MFIVPVLLQLLEPQEDVEEVVREQEVDGQKVLQVSETWAVERRAETPRWAGASSQIFGMN